MAFDPKIVFGLCNVLNRHAISINLSFEENSSHQYQVEQWAKRMDLTYRDSKTNWQSISVNPNKTLNNLTLIGNLFDQLVGELYKVEPAIEKQISKDLKKGGFLKVRKEIREKFDLLKKPIDKVNSSIVNGISAKIDVDEIAVLEAVVHVWQSCKKNKNLPKKLIKNSSLYEFTRDCMEVFEIKGEPIKSYQNWYSLNKE